MTEREWLECDNPLRMLGYLKASPDARKTLLLTAACIRRIWKVLPQKARSWVEMAERSADGLCAYDPNLAESCEHALIDAVQSTGWGDDGVICAVQQVFHVFWQVPEFIEAEEANSDWKTERRHQADLVRCVFGNPFRPLAPAVQHWNNNTAVKLARATYEGSRFADMPIVADALEVAGCTTAEILDHCRKPGVHVRGCWVLDQLLGKA
jgi:hypothetical protein